MGTLLGFVVNPLRPSKEPELHLRMVKYHALILDHVFCFDYSMFVVLFWVKYTSMSH